MPPMDTYLATGGAFRSFETGAVIQLPTGGGGGGGGGGTAGWVTSHTYDLTVNEGWTQTLGNRGLDGSYNRAAQTTYSGAGMLITAERSAVGATIYSSDAQARFYSIPNYAAVEIDVTLAGWIGQGCFPASWLMPITGRGEIDIWELMSARPAGNSHFKGTAIVTASGTTDYNRGQAAIQYDTTTGKIVSSSNPVVPGITPNGKHTYRIEKTAGQIVYYLDGVKKGTVTRAQVDASISAADASAGYSWDSQFESGHPWYLRQTYQFGAPTDGRAIYSVEDPPDTWVYPVVSTMLLSRAIVQLPQT